MLAALSGAATALAGCSSEPTPGERTTPEPEWTAVASPTEMTLYGATLTNEGPLAVGEGGRVVRRIDGDWRVELDDGPAGSHDGLTGVDATANGRRVWFCGGSGTVGRFDVSDGTVTDASAPKGKTSTWEDVAVAGLAGQEWLYLANGSGELLQGRVGGDGVSWRSVVEPGPGSSILAVSFVDRGSGYVCDTSGNVFLTVDAGDEWKRIGIDGAGVNLHDVAPRGADDVSVAGGDGTVFRYNGFSWTPVNVGEADVHGVVRDRHEGFAVDASGGVFELTRRGWKPEAVDNEAPLHDVALGTVDFPEVAVGAGGTVLERSRR